MADRKTTKKMTKKTEPAKTGTAVSTRVRIPWDPEIGRLYGEIGITEATWPALLDTMFPGVKDPRAIALALSYSRARMLDPFKVRVYVVPFQSQDADAPKWTIMNSIGDLRATAFRTGEYGGKTGTNWGPMIELGFKQGAFKIWVPEFAQMNVFRIVGGEPREFEGPTVWWEESYQTGHKTDVPNIQWRRRPRYMLEKCAEAAALRTAFPEETDAMRIPEEDFPEVDDVAARMEAAKNITPEKEEGPEPQDREPESEEPEVADLRFEFVRSDGELIENMNPESFVTHVAGILDRIRDLEMVDALVENNWSEVERLDETGESIHRQTCEDALERARERLKPKTRPGNGKPAGQQGTMLPEDDDQEELVTNISDKIRATETVSACDAYWRGVTRAGHPDPVISRCRMIYGSHRQDLATSGKV